MILIDSVYAHTSGGKVLLTVLINSIPRSDLSNYWIVFDSRFDKNYIKSINAGRITILEASESQRRKFYGKNQDRFKSIFCFGNVPPPITMKQRVLIYLQNDLLLSSKKTGLDLKARLILRLKKNYIAYLSKKKYHWAVQTSMMKKKLMDSLAIENDKIGIYPFYEELSLEKKNPSTDNSFLYVAGFGAHKNHEKLISAFNLAAHKNSTFLTLKLTLPNNAFSYLLKTLKNPSPNLRLVNLGILPKEQIIKNYRENQFCIYPSLKESFGLPLIEAAQMESFVIAADLPYVHEVIKPSLTFNPYSEKDIAKVILKAINLNSLPKSVIKVSNKLNALLNFISYDI